MYLTSWEQVARQILPECPAAETKGRVVAVDDARVAQRWEVLDPAVTGVDAVSHQLRCPPLGLTPGSRCAAVRFSCKEEQEKSSALEFDRLMTLVGAPASR